MLPVFRRFSRANVLGSFSVHPSLRSSTLLSSLRPSLWFHLPFLHHSVDDFFLLVLVLLVPPVTRPCGLRLLRAYQHADTSFATSPVITRSLISMRFRSWPFYNVFWLSNASAILNLRPSPPALPYDDDDDVAKLWYPRGVSHVMST